MKLVILLPSGSRRTHPLSPNETLDAHDFAIVLDRALAADPFAGSLFAEHPARAIGELVLDELSLARRIRAGLKRHMPLSHDLEFACSPEPFSACYFLADAGEHIHFRFDRNIFGAVVELRERLETQQVGALDVHLHVVRNAELPENFGKPPALDRDFTPSRAESLVAHGGVAADASPDVVVALEKADRPRSFGDGNVQQRQASGFYVASRTSRGPRDKARDAPR